MITSIRHIGLVVANLPRMIAFYELLGFKITLRQVESGQHINKLLGEEVITVETVKMAAPDKSLIELLYFQLRVQQPERKPIFNLGFSHVALTMPSVDKAYALLAEAGTKFSNPPEYLSDRCVKLAFARDPEGNWIELVEVFH